MKRAIQLIVSLGITAGSLVWTFKDTRWPEMWASLASANYLWLFPYLAILTAVHVTRTLRWGHLLAGLERIPFKPLNEASAIGFMMLIILPFRLGEFARPFLIAERSNIRRSPAMTSVVLERIVDGMSVALMLRGLLFFLPEDVENIGSIRFGANAMFAVFAGGLAFLIFATWQQARVTALIRATFGRVSEELGVKVGHIVDGFVGAMRQLPRGKDLVLFFVYTAVYWSLNGLGMMVFANAFDCQGAARVGCEPMDLSLFQGFVVLCVLVVGLMIPAAPGSAGTFQAAVKIALAVFLPPAVVNSSGVAFANLIWFVQMAQQIGFGIIFLLLSHQSFGDLTRKLSQKASAATGDA